jgi:ATP-dependent exoDNAse (exonuclease V) beta subunit
MTDGDQMVVVDYKTGDHDESGKYQRQVKGYIRHLRNMGYQNVTGYLWYVKLNLTEEVK